MGFLNDLKLLSDATNPLLVKIIMLNNIYNLLGIFIITFVGCGLISAGFNMLVDNNFIVYVWNEVSSTIIFHRKKPTPRYWLHSKKNWTPVIQSMSIVTLKFVQIFLELILTY